MDKPKIYFVPVNIGQIKYFERVAELLEEHYSIGFLLVRYNDFLLKQMLEYCRQKNLYHYVICLGFRKEKGIRIPFFSPIKKTLEHRKKCREFLKKEQPSKLIFEKTGNPHSMIACEANAHGVETIRLQSALLVGLAQNELIYGPGGSTLQSSLPAKIYFHILHLIYRGIGHIDGPTSCLRQGRTVTPKKLGVIDELTLKRIIGQFNPEPKVIRIVGTLDVGQTYELKKRITEDSQFRSELLRKYGIDSKKINIVMLVLRFHNLLRADGSTITKDEQLAYYRNLVLDIRAVFSSEEATITFKIHPRETDDMRKLYEALGVIVHGNESHTNELICLSNFCITDPATAANYFVIASGIPALFVNFSPITGLNLAAEFFGTKEIVDRRERFLELLKKLRRYAGETI